jgi:hypothetical protein
MTTPLAADVSLSGLVDMHVHSAPDLEPRFADDVDTVREAADAGMRAVLLKSHVTLTADRAALAEKVVGRLRVFGGIALNDAVGGINPAAVEVALKLGAKQVWMPTRDAAHERRYRGKTGGLTIFTDGGQIAPAVHDVIELVRGADAILGTGHLSPEETVALVRLAQANRLRKILVTHPEAYFLKMSAAVQAGIASEGVFFERCFVFTTAISGSTISVAGIAAQIRHVGVQSTVLSTDFGQAANPSAVAGLRTYLAELIACGFSFQEIHHMTGQNPAYLLGL